MGSRFEYRIFAEELHSNKEYLQKGFQKLNQLETTEEYLLSKKVHKYNIKIRDRKLDVKKLLLVEDGFEKWDLLYKKEFPIQAKSLNTLLGKNIANEKQALSESKLKALVKLQEDLRLVTLSKKRIQFENNNLLGEFTILSFENKTFHSIALESENLGELKKYTRILGLEAFRNINYYKFLQENIYHLQI